MSSEQAMHHVLLRTPQVEVRRQGRFLIAELLTPHRVLSTCQARGGESDTLRFLVNHQSSEGAAHADRAHQILDMGQVAYQQAVCAELGLPEQETAVMGTAANMQYAAVAGAEFEEFRLSCVSTAGVSGNACRAGDPTTWVERQGGFEPVTQQGTINIMLFSNVPLTQAALSRAVVTMTEAKTAVLQELAVPSRSSAGLATGTGTDQFCLAAPLDGRPPITWTGQHCKVGELIANAVMTSLREALRWQNGLEPSYTRDLCQALGRFGLTAALMREKIAGKLTGQALTFFHENEKAIRFEPQVAACAYAIAAILDRVAFGTLPAACADEVILHQCALMAGVLAAQPDQFATFYRQLAAGSTDITDRVVAALILGWQEKWS